MFNVKNGNIIVTHYKDKEYKILHNEDGPAVKTCYGHKEYWINGKRLSFLRFLLFRVFKFWKEFQEDLRKSKENPDLKEVHYLQNLYLYDYKKTVKKCKKSSWKK